MCHWGALLKNLNDEKSIIFIMNKKDRLTVIIWRLFGNGETNRYEKLAFQCFMHLEISKLRETPHM